MYNTDGQFAILRNCCRNGPIANYTGDDAPSDCFQYCNITDSGLTYQAVSQCIRSGLEKANMTAPWICGIGKHNNVTVISSSAPTPGKKNLGWMMLAIAITYTVMGADMAV